jgi:hypothetical protein
VEAELSSEKVFDVGGLMEGCFGARKSVSEEADDEKFGSGLSPLVDDMVKFSR